MTILNSLCLFSSSHPPTNAPVLVRRLFALSPTIPKNGPYLHFLPRSSSRCHNLCTIGWHVSEDRRPHAGAESHVRCTPHRHPPAADASVGFGEGSSGNPMSGTCLLRAFMAAPMPASNKWICPCATLEFRASTGL